MKKYLVLVAGLPACGKSLLARALSNKIKAVHLNSDSIRNKILKEKIYSEEEKELVYEKMFEEAKKVLKQGKNVVLDATFYRKKLRKQAKKTAVENNASFFIIECICPEQTVKKRMRTREKRKSQSEADFSVYLLVKNLFEKISEKHLVVDSEKPLQQQVNKALNYMGFKNE